MLNVEPVAAGSYTNKTNNFMYVVTQTGLHFWLLNGQSVTIPTGGAVIFASMDLDDFKGIPG